MPRFSGKGEYWKKKNGNCMYVSICGFIEEFFLPVF